MNRYEPAESYHWVYLFGKSSVSVTYCENLYKYIVILRVAQSHHLIPVTKEMDK